MGNFSSFWKQKTRVSQILFRLAMLYCVSSINVLILALGIAQWIPEAYLNPTILITFSLISFAFALLLSTYHWKEVFVP